MDDRTLKPRQITGITCKEHCTSVNKATVLPLKIRAERCGIYPVWPWILGLIKCSGRTLSENKFIRNLARLPPITLLRLDMGRRATANKASLPPILFWRRIWSTLEPSLCHCPAGCYAGLIKWAGWYILGSCCLHYVWGSFGNLSCHIMPSSEQLKMQYWALQVDAHTAAGSRLMGEFLKCK